MLIMQPISLHTSLLPLYRLRRRRLSISLGLQRRSIQVLDITLLAILPIH
jgi:hypothetical protein